MTCYSIEPRTRTYVKGYGFCHLREIYPIKMGKIIECCYKSKAKSSKNCFQKWSKKQLKQ